MQTYPEIETLIPHRKPILCIDEVVSVDGLIAKTKYKIEENSLFFSNGYFSELGLLENAAQSSFVFLNFFFESSQKENPDLAHKSVGFISQITNMEVIAHPKSGDELCTSTVTELVYDAENLKICNVKAESFVHSKSVFTAEMKLILQTH